MSRDEWDWTNQKNTPNHFVDEINLISLSLARILHTQVCVRGGKSSIKIEKKNYLTDTKREKKNLQQFIHFDSFELLCTVCSGWKLLLYKRRRRRWIELREEEATTWSGWEKNGWLWRDGVVEWLNEWIDSPLFSSLVMRKCLVRWDMHCWLLCLCIFQFSMSLFNFFQVIFNVFNSFFKDKICK